MGIRFLCEHCQHKLNVKAFLGGKRGICPHCGGGIDIPTESLINRDGTPLENAPSADTVSGGLTGSPSIVVQTETPDPKPTQVNPYEQQPTVNEPAGATATNQPQATPAPQPAPAATPTNDVIADAPDAVWYVRPPSGGQYGPAAGDTMRKWLDQGRVSFDSLVWREGWPDWKQAGAVFPNLSPSGDSPSSHSAPAMTAKPREPASVASIATNIPPTANHHDEPSSARLRNNDTQTGWGISILVLLAGLCLAIIGGFMWFIWNIQTTPQQSTASNTPIVISAL